MSKSSNTGREEQNGGPELTASERHRLLSVEQRRFALDVLGERTAPVDLDYLASAILSRADGTATDREAELRKIRTALHHCHLPVLAEAGVIEYDPEANRVETVQIRPEQILG
jgi:hypothetical protein